MINHACITLNPDYCINCKACEIHCSVWNSLPIPLGHHSGDLPYMEGDKIMLPVQYFACMHCHKPLCLKVCKLDAMYLGDDNMVFINEDKCNGCGDCIKACPTHVPLQNPQNGKVVKCDLCASRRAMGEEPACVAGCPSRALVFSEDESEHRKLLKTQLRFIKQYGK